MTDSVAHQRRVPQLLPPDVTHFTDRETELGTLDSLLTTAVSGSSAAVVISAIAGMGKTSLAVHWAHRVRDRFPDGQLYVNLRGYDPGQPVTPEQALDGLLRALDVQGEAIPHGVDAMAGYYRSLVADRRMLVVLDNVATPDQVRPLLPASPSCVVLVTSRSRLSGLVARDGTQRITLDLLPPDEAVTLLHTVIGADRADREPEAMAELARRCAYLPLALRIAAERVTARPHLRIADLVSDLSLEQDRLAALAVDDDETSTVRAVFSWSYRALTPEAARAFRLLGLHPGPDVSIAAAAALTNTTPAEARRLLDVLASVHLLEEIGPDRYAFHDLLRAYAAERTAIDEPDAEPDNATGRILDWYLHTAHAASRVVWPIQPQKPIDFPGSDCEPLTLASYEEALYWLDTELTNLMSAIHHAAATGWHAITWQLPLVLVDFFILRSRWSYLITALQIGLAAARHVQDRQAEYWTLTCLAEAYVELERFDEAIAYAQDALTVTRGIGDRRGEGVARHDLGRAHHGMGRLDDAIDHFQNALAIYREVGDQRGEGIMLSLVGHVLREQQRFDDALDHAQQGLAILQAIDSRWNQAAALRRLGLIYQDLQRLHDAIEALQQALNIYHDLDHHYEGALTLQDLGEAQYIAGEPDKARQRWHEALAIFEDLNSPRAAEVRARLDALA